MRTNCKIEAKRIGDELHVFTINLAVKSSVPKNPSSWGSIDFDPGAVGEIVGRGNSRCSRHESFDHLRLSALKHLTDLTLPDNGAGRRRIPQIATEPGAD